MDPDQTAWMRRLVWIHAGRKRITLVFVETRLIFTYHNVILTLQIISFMMTLLKINTLLALNNI
jgi:hypothetical protein